ncbi:hypothetical protein IU433_17195 [Nocardia puris]|nr:hypothetical protein [Nocardia puris]MBF6366843.1 hypothetical protein [Nocardia puris]MBF6460769.1 hypothetical protein [Nocardia puris]
MTAYSWTSFPVDQGTYAEWIDRGRPSPRHHVWAAYLRWVAAAIDLDLAVRNLDAKLYLPNLAALAQGPGFPNLSCLGELSDRVLRIELARAEPAAAPARDRAVR